MPTERTSYRTHRPRCPVDGAAATETHAVPNDGANERTHERPKWRTTTTDAHRITGAQTNGNSQKNVRRSHEKFGKNGANTDRNSTSERSWTVWSDQSRSRDGDGHAQDRPRALRDAPGTAQDRPRATQDEPGSVQTGARTALQPLRCTFRAVFCRHSLLEARSQRFSDRRVLRKPQFLLCFPPKCVGLLRAGCIMRKYHVSASKTGPESGQDPSKSSSDSLWRAQSRARTREVIPNFHK